MGGEVGRIDCETLRMISLGVLGRNPTPACVPTPVQMARCGRSRATVWGSGFGRKGPSADFIFWGSKITADDDCLVARARALPLPLV